MVVEVRRRTPEFHRRDVQLHQCRTRQEVRGGWHSASRQLSVCRQVLALRHRRARSLRFRPDRDQGTARIEEVSRACVVRRRSSVVSLVLPVHYAIDHRWALTITPAPLRRDTHCHGPLATRMSPDLFKGALRWHLTIDPFFPTVIADVILFLTPILAESGRPPFFCRSFSWAMLQANSCVRQLRVFCFPGSALRTLGFPPIKQPHALEAEALAFGCPKKRGRKRRHFHVLLELSNDRRICWSRSGAESNEEQRFEIHRSFRRHATHLEKCR